MTKRQISTNKLTFINLTKNLHSPPYLENVTENLPKSTTERLSKETNKKLKLE